MSALNSGHLNIYRARRLSLHCRPTAQPIQADTSRLGVQRELTQPTPSGRSYQKGNGQQKRQFVSVSMIVSLPNEAAF